jgi:hypothetical protein
LAGRDRPPLDPSQGDHAARGEVPSLRTGRKVPELGGMCRPEGSRPYRRNDRRESVGRSHRPISALCLGRRSNPSGHGAPGARAERCIERRLRDDTNLHGVDEPLVVRRAA